MPTKTPAQIYQDGVPPIKADIRLWMTEVLAEGDVGEAALEASGKEAIISSEELGSIVNTTEVFQNGAIAWKGTRGFRIPAGSSGDNSLYIMRLPILGIVETTVARFTFRLVTSVNIDAQTVFAAGAAIYAGDGTTTAVFAAITKLGPQSWTITVDRTIDADDAMIEVTLVIDAASAIRGSEGWVLLGGAGIAVTAAASGRTRNSMVVSYLEKIEAIRAETRRPAREYFVNSVSSPDNDYASIHDATAAIAQGDGPNLPARLRVGAGTYVNEVAYNQDIKPKSWVNIEGQGLEHEVVIDARLPNGTANNGSIQGMLIQDSTKISSLTILAKNIRYPIHPEVANTKFGLQWIFEDLVLKNEGGDGGALTTALGIGQHHGNRIEVRRCVLESPLGAIGFHNSADWRAPASGVVEDSHLIAYDVEGSAVSASSHGAGLPSVWTFRNTVIGGLVYQGTALRLSAKLSAHRANRYEYKLVFDSCSPFDWTSDCIVDALELQSVAGAASAVAVSGAGVLPLFGPRPDYRAGGVGLAARAISWHAITSTINDVTPPDVSLAARLGNLSGAALGLTIAFDALGPIAISLDANYIGMTNTAIVTSLNTKLATAMGGSAGGRAFIISQPYANRAPIIQPGREGFEKNNDTSAILRGHALAWDGRHVRRMTSADAVDLFAGVALHDAPPAAPCRFQRNGWINQVHLAFTGTPSVAARDRFEVGATAGELVEGATRPVLRARSLRAAGATFEVI